MDDDPAGAVPATALRLAGISAAAPLGAVLQQVAEAAAGVVPAAAYSMALVRGGQPRAMEFTTGSAAAVLDERQYPVGYGPALAVALTGQKRVVDTGAGAGRHREFCRLAHRHGVRQIASFPVHMPVDVGAAAALTLYADEPPRPGVLDDVARMAGTVSRSVADAVRYQDAVLRGQQLEQAMMSRATIEQAKGMIMLSLGCSAEEAFEVLKRVSSHTNRKLRDVAVAVVTGRMAGDRLLPLTGS